MKLARDQGGRVYAIDTAKRHLSPAEYPAYRALYGEPIPITNGQAAAIPDAVTTDNIEQRVENAVARHTAEGLIKAEGSGAVYQMVLGMKRAFVSQTSFLGAGFEFARVGTIDQKAFDAVPNFDDVIRNIVSEELKKVPPGGCSCDKLPFKFTGEVTK